MNVPDSSTSWNRPRICGIRRSYCARTSTRGTGTASNGRRAPAKDQPGNEADDRDHDEVLDPAEVAVEPVPVGAEGPADRREAEAPRHAAEEGEDREPVEPHPQDARRYRDERADDGHDAAEEDRGVAEAVEPAIGALELRAVQVEPAAVVLEQRPAAVGADAPADQRADRVAEHARHRDDEVRPEMGRDPIAEEHDVLVREDARGEGAGVDHHELA